MYSNFIEITSPITNNLKEEGSSFCKKVLKQNLVDIIASLFPLIFCRLTISGIKGFIMPR